MTASGKQWHAMSMRRVRNCLEVHESTGGFKSRACRAGKKREIAFQNFPKNKFGGKKFDKKAR
jgi:hypothetical protein